MFYTIPYTQQQRDAQIDSIEAKDNFVLVDFNKYILCKNIYVGPRADYTPNICNWQSRALKTDEVYFNTTYHKSRSVPCLLLLLLKRPAALYWSKKHSYTTTYIIKMQLAKKILCMVIKRNEIYICAPVVIENKSLHCIWRWLAWGGFSCLSVGMCVCCEVKTNVCQSVTPSSDICLMLSTIKQWIWNGIIVVMSKVIFFPYYSYVALYT